MTSPESRTVCVVGLGKIGLPLAVQYASRGFRVRGLDVNAETIDLVNEAREPFPGEHDLARRLTAAVHSGLLTATADAQEAVGSSEVVVVVVPIVVEDNGAPDFRAMDHAVEAIGQAVRPGALVLFETTVPVGTTRTRFAPALVELSGLTLGVDLFVVYSPERVLTGRTFADLRRYPKVIGGLESAGALRATEFYEAALEFDERPDLARPNGVWDLGSAEAAELVKLAETTFRDVNIALANTFAVYAENNGIDVHAVIEACNSQPFSLIHSPGVAVGGHCIPVYPQLYLTTDPGADLVRVARRVNASMPARVLDRLEGLLAGLEGRRVAVLGAAYRGGVKETAFSGVFPIVFELANRGAVPLVHDPLFSDEELVALGLVPYHRGEATDAAIVQADHAEYRLWGPEDIPGVVCLVDGRAFTSDENWPGVTHVVIGR